MRWSSYTGKEEVVTKERETKPHLQGRHKKENKPLKEVLEASANTSTMPNPSAIRTKKLAHDLICEDPESSPQPHLRLLCYYNGQEGPYLDR